MTTYGATSNDTGGIMARLLVFSEVFTRRPSIMYWTIKYCIKLPSFSAYVVSPENYILSVDQRDMVRKRPFLLTQFS